MTAAQSLRVDSRDPTPPYEQLRRQLAELIGAGQLAPGDRLPPLRQLAADLGLAVGTVARTYRELEAGGLVVSRRGAGTRVRHALDTQPAPPQLARQALDRYAEAFLRHADLLGANPLAVRAALDRALAARS